MIRINQLLVGVFALSVLVTLGFAPPSWAQDAAAPMDHAALAASYQAEAKAAQQKAAEHETMMNRYKTAPSFPKGVAFPKEAMTQHCQKLVDSYKQAAGEAGNLAKMHQEAAQAAK
jgi:hypothetical protein